MAVADTVCRCSVGADDSIVTDIGCRGFAVTGHFVVADVGRRRIAVADDFVVGEVGRRRFVAADDFAVTEVGRCGFVITTDCIVGADVTPAAVFVAHAADADDVACVDGGGRRAPLRRAAVLFGVLPARVFVAVVVVAVQVIAAVDPGVILDDVLGGLLGRFAGLHLTGGLHRFLPAGSRSYTVSTQRYSLV